MQKNQKAYTRPKVVVYGNVEKITAGATYGNFTDQTFPVDTPKDQLTFSG